MTIRLTRLAKRAGCAAKQPPGFLLPLLSKLPAPADPNVLIGSASADDAAVYRLDDERALVLTTDFFTPIVDDPTSFGAIAVANALSDVYAMGGRPLTALNLVGFPPDLDVAILGEILLGGSTKATEAGIDLVGGHTIKSDEPIYGLSVTGMVHPDRIVNNAGACDGDLLVLTKPIGVGILTTAAKNDEDDLGAIDDAIALMSVLNDRACAAMCEVGVNAATDVTGFGLLGHLRNMAAASACRAFVHGSDVPVIDAARTYAERGIVPGGTHANWRFLNDFVTWGKQSKAEQLLLCDAQTSGGLLMAVAADRASALVEALSAAGTSCAAIVGGFDDGPAGTIVVD